MLYDKDLNGYDFATRQAAVGSPECITLRRHDFLVRKVLNRDFHSDLLEYREFADEHLLNRMAMELRLIIYGKDIKEVTVASPATVWDHIKQDWMPKWALKWLKPVAQKETVIKAQEFYPFVSIPEKHPEIRIFKVTPQPMRLF